MPTYIEIHPFWYDSVTVSNEMFRENKRPQKEYYHSAEPQVIRIDTIKRIKGEYVSDDSINLKRLVISDDYHDDILVSEEQGEKIKETLLKTKEPIAAELSILSGGISSHSALPQTQVP